MVLARSEQAKYSERELTMIRKMAFVSYLVSTCFLFAVTGCDNHAPTAANFESGLNVYLQANPQCVWTGGKLPGNYIGSLKGDDGSGFDKLVAIGLLSKTPGELYHGAGTTGRIWRYDLTDAGRKLASESFHGTDLCYGTKKVVKIANFTEPGENKESTVTYTWKLTNIPAWAYDPAVSATFTHVVQTGGGSEEEHTGQAQMVLTNLGWRVAGQ